MAVYFDICVIFMIIGIMMTTVGIAYRKRLPAVGAYLLLAFGIFIIVAGFSTGMSIGFFMR